MCKEQEEKIQTLLKNISQEKQSTLAGLEFAYLQVLNSTLVEWQQKVMKNKGLLSDPLRHYIPLRGGAMAEAPDEKTFDMFKHITKFLQGSDQD